MEPNRIQDKIRKLLAMARDGRGNENEAETALRQAEALMRKHGIEEADVTLKQLQDNFESDEWEHGGGKDVPPYIDLLSVGVSYFTDTIVRKIRRPEGTRLRFSGEASDVAVAAWLLPYLVEAVKREQKKDKVRSSGAENASYRRSAAGMLQTRMRALRAEREEVFKKAPGNALVVVDTKRQKVQEMFGDTKFVNRSLSIRDSDAAAKGLAAGRRININNQIGGSSRKQIGS